MHFAQAVGERSGLVLVLVCRSNMLLLIVKTGCLLLGVEELNGGWLIASIVEVGLSKFEEELQELLMVFGECYSHIWIQG